MTTQAYFTNPHASIGNAEVPTRNDRPQQYSLIVNGILHLLLKQHSKPDLPKNQQHPMKRIKDKPAVAHNKAWKKCWVLLFALL